LYAALFRALTVFDREVGFADLLKALLRELKGAIVFGKSQILLDYRDGSEEKRESWKGLGQK
jgi:hypothetical protein